MKRNGQFAGYGVATIASIAALAACSTAASVAMPATTAFGPASNRAFLVVAASSHREVDMTATFRQVDLGKGTFGREKFVVSSDAMPNWGTPTLHANKLDLGSDTVPALVGQEIAPGDYALVEWRSTSGEWIWERCFESSAPVFHITPGRISIVQLDFLSPVGELTRPKSPESIRQQFETVRTKYPAITGDADVIPPAKQISWSIKEGLFSGQTCSTVPNFTVSP